MQAFIFVHHPAPPFHPKGEVRTATDVDRLRSLDQPGTLTFRCSSDEAGVAFQEGDALVDRSTEGIAPWLWFVSRISDVLDEGIVEVEAQEWRQILYRRIVPLGHQIEARIAATIAYDLLSAVNGRHASHIRADERFSMDSRSVLPAGRMALAGNSLGQAFDELAARTDSEWWVHYHVFWNSVEPTLHWAYRRGADLSERVHVVERHHLRSAVYSRDLTDATRTIQFLGSGQSVDTTPAGSVVVDEHISLESGPAGGKVEAAGELERRIALKIPAAAMADRVEILPSDESEPTLVGASRSFIRLPASAHQSMDIALRSVAPLIPPSIITSAPQPFWSAFDLGDVITIRMQTARFGNPITIRARVVAMQPDEASGEMPLVVEVEQGTIVFLRGLE